MNQDASQSRSQSSHMLSLLKVKIGPTVAVVGLASFIFLGVLAPEPGYSMPPPQLKNQQAKPVTQWLTGSKLDRFNQSSLSVSWVEAPLKSRLQNYAKLKKTAVFLDRRIDPSNLINLAVNSVSPEQFLWSVADSQEIGVCRIGDLYYFGPPSSTASLPTLWKSMRRDTSKNKRTHKVAWSQRTQLKTDTVFEPKALLEKIAKDNNFTIENLDELRHDVWIQLEVPPMSIDAQVALLLVGFDKWFERSADGSSIKIVDFEEVKIAELELKRSKNFPDPKKPLAEMQAKYPDLKITGTRQRFSASGPPKSIANLKNDLVKRQVTERVDPKLIRFSLTARNKRLEFVKTVVAQYGKKLKYNPQDTELLEEVITLKLENANLEQLLEASLKGTGLKYKIKDSEIEIYK